MGKKITHEEFVQTIEQINPNVEVLGKYEKSNIKILCRCKIDGHEWEVFPNNIKKYGCPECWRRKRTLSNEKFLEKMKLINPNIEPLEEYKGYKIKILCKCTLDNFQWKARPDRLLSVQGCPMCNRIKMAKKQTRTNEDFLQELSIINPNVEPLENYVKNTVKILCRCKIDGHKWMIEPRLLFSGKGCPICNESKGEKAVASFLDNNSIFYEREKSFDDLLGVNNGFLRYDFYIPEYNLLLEYNGRQHEVQVNFDGLDNEQSKKKFKIQQEHDRRKKEYALSNGYDFLEIWYYDYDNIETILKNKLNLKN